MLNFYQQLAKTLKKDAVVLATVTSTGTSLSGKI
jgi:hypothetical protein